MKILVTGVSGQLGHDVVNEALSRGYEVLATDVVAPSLCRSPFLSLDITDRLCVCETIQMQCPDAVIHCAAWTNVDGAEESQNLAKVDAINRLGTQNLAEACSLVGSKMMYISTDYVFDGKGDRPWQPDDKHYSPLNIYGKSKLDGELAVSSILEKYFIVRIAWVFGLNGNNFIKTMMKVGRTHDSVRVVNDQIGTPTYTKDLARLLVDMVETEKYGYYHATNSELPENGRDPDGTKTGYISWYDFTREIFRQAGIPAKVIPVTTAEYGLSKAVRPYNSRLDKTKLVAEGFKPLPDWKSAVQRYLMEAKLIDGTD